MGCWILFVMLLVICIICTLCLVFNDNLVHTGYVRVEMILIVRLSMAMWGGVLRQCSGM